ncbi:AraC family transcriptional regulator [Mucilaginibacter koreensis]
MHKNGAIPVNSFGDDSGAGISVERIAFDNLPELGEWEQPERHDCHTFFLLEQGSVHIEIDFQQYQIKAPSIIYMHPDQVHRIIGFAHVIVSALAMDNEYLNPEYLKLLEEITPAMPVAISPENFEMLKQAASLCIRYKEREKDTLYQSLLKDYCNGWVGIIITIYLEQLQSTDKTLRAEYVTKAFRQALALHFTRLKRPADYAEQLHLSTSYLNECVKSTTGQSVTWHIQQRVILEAKRLIHHSNQSLKEIALALGYDDYAYFSRLFTKVAGMSPVAFRLKNLG